MTEYWVEENIRPVSLEASDTFLINDIEPIVNALKQEGIVSWHYLREGDGWRTDQAIKHIRLRFKANSLEHLKKIRRILKRKLDALQGNQAIADHYVGRHGKPVKRYKDYYQGENSGFDEQTANPEGWSLVEKYLEIGSEMALLLIKGRIRRLQLGPEYGFYKISHCFPNQCRHYPHLVVIQTQSGPRNWIAYDPETPQ